MHSPDVSAVSTFYVMNGRTCKKIADDIQAEIAESHTVYEVLIQSVDGVQLAGALVTICQQKCVN